MMMLNSVIVQPIAALVAGFLVLLLPRALNVVVALYLIAIGMLGLWPHIGFSTSWLAQH